MKMFQSSTRFEVSASRKRRLLRRHCPGFNPLRGSKFLQAVSTNGVFVHKRVSILYEVRSFCKLAAMSAMLSALGFNPLRGSKFLQGCVRLNYSPVYRVSILYEVRSFCKRGVDY